MMREALAATITDHAMKYPVVHLNCALLAEFALWGKGVGLEE